MSTKIRKTTVQSCSEKLKSTFFSLTALSYPNGPNRRIHVPKCGLQTNCIQNWGLHYGNGSNNVFGRKRRADVNRFTYCFCYAILSSLCYHREFRIKLTMWTFEKDSLLHICSRIYIESPNILSWLNLKGAVLGKTRKKCSLTYLQNRTLLAPVLKFTAVPLNLMT